MRVCRVLLKAKKEICRRFLSRDISFPFSAQLIYICILYAEAQCLGVAAEENVYVAISGSAVFYRVNLTVNQQLCAERYAAHGNCSAGGRCGSACGGSAGPLSGTDGTGAIASQLKFSKVRST